MHKACSPFYLSIDFTLFLQGNKFLIHLYFSSILFLTKPSILLPQTLILLRQMLFHFDLHNCYKYYKELLFITNT